VVTPASFVTRVAARDRALYHRFRLSPTASAARRTFWKAITHAGGSATTLVASLAPLWFENPIGDGARRATILLVASHLVVQLVKRTVGRPRPAGESCIVRPPDRFSFPSGHSAAAFSVAMGYASVNPALALPLLAAAALVGASRVVLGVHFPADVVAGQAIAVMTAAVLSPVL
jgi:undecaprenyl-diphosphatase